MLLPLDANVEELLCLFKSVAQEAWLDSKTVIILPVTKKPVSRPTLPYNAKGSRSPDFQYHWHPDFDMPFKQASNCRS